MSVQVTLKEILHRLIAHIKTMETEQYQLLLN